MKKYIDTEEANSVDDISIHGYPGMMVIKENRITIEWTEEEHGNSIVIVSTNLNKDNVISIAENIFYISS